MTVDPFSPIAGSKPTSAKRKKPLRTCVVPVPPNGHDAPERHYKLGKPSQRWEYRNAACELLGYVCRYDEKDGGKSFRPLCLFEEKGKADWRYEAWPEPRPLYGLDRLASDTSAPVIVTEGEKSADAAGKLLPGYVCVTSPSGSKAAGKADWSPLEGRDVIIWPDADTPGQKYAKDVAALVLKADAASASILTNPDQVPKGWDAGDALGDGWSERKAKALVDNAALVGSASANNDQNTSSNGDKDEGRKRPRQVDGVIAVAEGAELWHSPENVAYATIRVAAHYEHWRIESASFKRWLSGQVFEATGSVPGGQILSDALRVLDYKAVSQGTCHQPLMRVGSLDGSLWLDLCDAEWRAVKITAMGWEIVAKPDVKFIRVEVMAALPAPTVDDDCAIEELRSFVNAEEDDFKLIVGWLLAALWGRATAFPVLALGGEQGSGKSTMARLLRGIVDRSAVDALSIPKDERDFFTMAANGHVLSFDNVSKVAPWFSDVTCRVSSGAGFMSRKLHSDDEAHYFKGAKPVLLNGIPSLTGRADLASRSLTVQLLRIDDTVRQSEDDLWDRWTPAHPRVLAALLDVLSAALGRYDDIKLDSMPRMAAFAKLMAAAEPALGWEPGEFMVAYEANRRATNEATFEADPVAVEILKFINQECAVVGQFWEGTAAVLKARLEDGMSEDIRRSHFWPKSVIAMGNALTRATPLLRQKGITVDRRNTGDHRLITLTRTH